MASSILDAIRERAFLQSGGKPKGASDIEQLGDINAHLKNLSDIYINRKLQKQQVTQGEQSLESNQIALEEANRKQGYQNLLETTLKGKQELSPEEIANLPYEGREKILELQKKGAEVRSTEALAKQRLNPKTYYSSQPARGTFSDSFMLQVGVPQERLNSVTIAEVNKLAGFEAADTAANRPQNVPGEELKSMKNSIKAIKGFERIKSEYFDLLAQGKSPVDPIKGRFVNLAQRFKLLDDSSQAKFISDIKGRMNRYLNELSGAAISPDEAKRLKSRLADIASTGSQYLAELDSVTDEIQDDLDANVEVLRLGGYKMRNLGELSREGKNPPSSSGNNKDNYEQDKQNAIDAINAGKDPVKVKQRFNSVYPDRPL